jgi:tRNA threonylcarbamoyladenosine biosynthesis protein TsaB
MKILALETSGRHASLAALIGNFEKAQLLAHAMLGGEGRTAQVLAPRLRQLLADVEWPPRSVELVAVTVGPGSFTGLRIGVTTAKTFAYAVGAEIIGVNTLAVLASQVPPVPAPLWAIIDAQRQELFAARFAPEADGQFNTPVETRIVPQASWLAALQPGDHVTGPAVPRLATRLPHGVIPVAEEHWQPTAAAVGRLAWQQFRAGQRDDLWKLAPAYYRPSAAEEKAARSAAPSAC